MAGQRIPASEVRGVGCIEGQVFSACAVQSDLVILDRNYQRVQVIARPAESDPTFQWMAIGCCTETGRIAAGFHKAIKVFKATPDNVRAGAAPYNNFNYRWIDGEKIRVDDVVKDVIFAMNGRRLMVVCGSNLILYENQPNEEERSRLSFGVNKLLQDKWSEVWRMPLEQPILLLKFSPDANYFVTCEVNGKDLKIWYNDNPGVSRPFKMKCEKLVINSIVTGVEWRQIGRLIPRRFVRNSFVVWTEGGEAFLYREMLPMDELLSIDEAVCQMKNLIWINSKDRVPVNLREALEGTESSEPLRKLPWREGITVGKSTIFAKVHRIRVGKDDLRPHWLNIKDHEFTEGIERLLENANIEGSPPDDQSMKWNEERTEVKDSRSRWPTATAIVTPTKPVTVAMMTAAEDVACTSKSIPSRKSKMDAEEAPDEDQMSGRKRKLPGSMASRGALDAQLREILLQWHDKSDCLVAVHPVDGSIHCWSLSNLDGVGRVIEIGKHRLDRGIPAGDAASINHMKFVTYKEDQVQRTNGIPGSDTPGPSVRQNPDAKMIFVQTIHVGGALNRWLLKMREDPIENYLHVISCDHKGNWP